jgi:hypothetical protein
MFYGYWRGGRSASIGQAAADELFAPKSPASRPCCSSGGWPDSSCQEGFKFEGRLGGILA